METIRLIIYLISLLVSLYGWGLGFQSLSKAKETHIAMSICVGMAFIIFIGGTLNCLSIAYGFSLNLIIFTGIGLLFTQRETFLKQQKQAADHLFALMVIIFIMIPIAYLHTSPDAYNFHDDFEKYFSHPVRMLQTGTLFGSPISAIGSETLGGQAFLHSFILNHFSFKYLNSLDAVLGLCICLGLLTHFNTKSRIKQILLCCNALLLIFIEPQYVNISALYTAAAVIMASMLLLSSSERITTTRTAITLGLFYAAACALKSNLVTLPVIHFSCIFLALLFYKTKLKQLLLFSIKTVSSTCFFLSPWLLLHLPNYIKSSPQESIINEVFPAKLPSIFSFKPLFYGASYGQYSLLLLLVICLTSISIYKLKSSKNKSLKIAVFTSVSTSCIAYILLLYTAPKLNGYGSGLRYIIPFLIAGSTSAFVLSIKEQKELQSKPYSLTVILLSFLCLITFLKPFIKRQTQLIEHSNQLAFTALSTSENYPKYALFTLSEKSRNRIQKIQSLVPQGENLFAWIYSPFHLNYQRNPIYDTESAGIATPWAKIPQTNYYIYEYRGYAVRTLKSLESSIKSCKSKHQKELYIKTVELIKQLDSLKQSSEILYDDGGIALFKVKVNH